MLDRVGGLLLLSNTELATTKQVAEFYGIPSKTLNSVIQRNRQELESNGKAYMKFPEIRETIANNPNFLNVKNLELTPRELGLSPIGSFIFTQRAVLNVGFMLEQSQVALEVRNQALNINESASDEQKTFEITKEKEQLKAFMFASNEVERPTAINEHLEWTNRHKEQLEETIEKQTKVITHKSNVIKELTDNISLADKRQILNKVIQNGQSFLCSPTSTKQRSDASRINEVQLVVWITLKLVLTSRTIALSLFIFCHRFINELHAL